MDDIRRVFDTIPEQFDRWRPRYCPELFDYLVKECRLGPGVKCLEIGPGTGQATDFALDAGCDYLAVELGEHLAAFMREKYRQRPNFRLVNADFETCDFGGERFDLIYSAAAIQWIDEKIAFTKCLSLLKDGGTLAMFKTIGDYKTPDPALYADVQKVYDKYFVTRSPYRQQFHYERAEEYGFRDLRVVDFHGTRRYSADEYLAYIGTHSDHILLDPAYREQFFTGIGEAIRAHGGKIAFADTYRLYLCRR